MGVDDVAPEILERLTSGGSGIAGVLAGGMEGFDGVAEYAMAKAMAHEVKKISKQIYDMYYEVRDFIEDYKDEVPDEIYNLMVKLANDYTVVYEIMTDLAGEFGAELLEMGDSKLALIARDLQTMSGKYNRLKKIRC